MQRIEQTDEEGKVVLRWVLGDSEKAFIPASATNLCSSTGQPLIHMIAVRGWWTVKYCTRAAPTTDSIAAA